MLLQTGGHIFPGDQTAPLKSGTKKGARQLNERVFLEYGPTHTDSMKLLAGTERTPQAIYLCEAHENVIYFHSRWITVACDVSLGCLRGFGDICASVKPKKKQKNSDTSLSI